MTHSICLIESSRANGLSLVNGLCAEGYELHHFAKISDAITSFVDHSALMIINAAAVHSSGKQILRKARTHFDIPLLLLSVSGTKLLPPEPGFNHLIAPFTMRKLNNRIKKQLPPRESSSLKIGNIQLLPKRHQLIIDKQLITLTPLAFKLLRALIKNPGHAVSRKQLMREVWGTDYMGDTRTLDTHVSWLRAAIGMVQKDQTHIVTVRNVGYRFEMR